MIDKPAGLPVDAPRRGGDSIASQAGRAALRLQAAADADAPARHGHQRLPAVRAHAQGARRVPAARSRARPVEKYYLAVVAGEIAEAERHDRPAARQAVERGGRLADGRRPAGLTAITRWRRIAVRDGPTLVEFRPVTGRTHQIRVHAREAFGRGIVGDRVYGVPGGPMLLHASRLVVPRERQAGDRRDRAASRLFRRVARCGLRTSRFPRTR